MSKKEKGIRNMASSNAFDRFPKDAYDWFSITKAQFPSYAFAVDLNIFPGTDYLDLIEDEIVESLKKIKRGQPLSERERRFWEEVEKDTKE
jgi:hypothetical protein